MKTDNPSVPLPWCCILGIQRSAFLLISDETARQNLFKELEERHMKDIPQIIHLNSVIYLFQMYSTCSILLETFTKYKELGCECDEECFSCGGTCQKLLSTNQLFSKFRVAGVYPKKLEDQIILNLFDKPEILSVISTPIGKLVVLSKDVESIKRLVNTRLQEVLQGINVFDLDAEGLIKTQGNLINLINS